MTSGAIASPSSSASSITDLSILARPSPNVFLVGAVLTHKSGEGESGRSSISICEVTLPPNGVGMNTILGRQAITSEYLCLDVPGSSAPPLLSRSIDELIRKLDTSLKGSEPLPRVEGIWKAWLTIQELGLLKRKLDIREVLFEASVRNLLRVVFEAALTPVEKNGADESSRIRTTRRYASRVVKDLLSRKVVTDTMWPGGVVAGALLPLGDWVSRPPDGLLEMLIS